ncbi:putative nucleic acid-binding protein [Medicago truncatula]|uniref:Putative nucleic acid-binding protein n=1 Tax=Medicago truncatula TaxID=3880 RepID=G7JSH7_MEDTR|nr:hypothetical protein MTR_4g037530 [Medicago truncatula]RHN60138.1 putative nucleic acid-binding protein [Medicago truncatula]
MGIWRCMLLHRLHPIFPLFLPKEAKLTSFYHFTLVLLYLKIFLSKVHLLILASLADFETLQHSQQVEVATSKKVQGKRGYKKIIDVNDSKGVRNLVVRVVDLWTVIIKQRQESMDMIIVDKENVKIQFTVPTEELAEHKEKLELNKTYDMQNFKVFKNELVVLTLSD